VSDDRVEAAKYRQRRAEERDRDLERWMEWSDGRYPDDSPGDVIHATRDGTIVLDDGVTTWNPLRALAWYADWLAANGCKRQ
jgi:hypothetical protein